MRLFDKIYRVAELLTIDSKFFNSRFRSVDDRLHSLEEVKGSWAEESARLSKIAIDQVTALMADAANVSASFAHLGAILSVKSLSTFSIQEGVVTLIVNEADRSKVPSAAFIAAVPLGIADAGLSGIMTEWDADTGVMKFHGSSLRGEGTYSEWVVGLAAPDLNADASINAQNIVVTSGETETDVAAVLASQAETIEALGEAIAAVPVLDPNLVYAHAAYRSVQ